MNLKSVFSCACLLIFSACAQSGGIAPATPAHSMNVGVQGVARSLSSYRTIFSFGGKYGVNPNGSLLWSIDRFYSITGAGGRPGSCSTRSLCGTIFSVTPSGVEGVLHSFTGGVGGAQPIGGLAQLGSTMYGVTGSGNGVIFSIDGSGVYHVVHNCIGGPYDHRPQGPLTRVGSKLYGVMWGDGGVFSMTPPSAAITYVYKFTDGPLPNGALLFLNGIFYGTTQLGGLYNMGMVYKVDAEGHFGVIHNFQGSDGEYPASGLTLVGSTLYGVTKGGGANNAGVVFSITPAGKTAVVYSFGSASGDGANPTGSLLDVQGYLYGTTPFGGSANGGGTLYKLSTAGVETILHQFGASGDGAYPEAGLSLYNGALYGGTVTGGANQSGTIFEATP